jgi:hypothetical protein
MVDLLHDTAVLAEATTEAESRLSAIRGSITMDLAMPVRTTAWKPYERQ